jgi:SOS response regulatory protein OraA/RecX
LNLELAYERALRRLRRSDAFSAEIREVLVEFPEDVREVVLVRLDEKGLVNDRRLTFSCVEASQGKRASGRLVLSEKLRARGASDEDLAEAWEAGPSEQDRARGLLDTRPAAGRMTWRRYLLSRGFEADVVDEVLDARLGASE